MFYYQNNKYKLLTTRKKKPKLIYVSRRSMQTLRNLMFRGVPNEKGTRGYATITSWSQKIRVQSPIQPGEDIPNYRAHDKITGLEIMNPRDASGSNHMLLADKTFISDDYYLIRGCFTSSTKIIDGIVPEKISDSQFNGKVKAQYFLRYPKPKLILKSDVKTAKLDIYENPEKASQQTPDQKKFIKTVDPIEKDIY